VWRKVTGRTSGLTPGLGTGPNGCQSSASDSPVAPVEQGAPLPPAAGDDTTVMYDDYMPGLGAGQAGPVV